jgi:murein DD-endopeptidase MepM/ murein hydrolase activator NlpD
MARFGGGGIDDIFTASTPNQRQIINQDSQPFPADTPVAAAPVDGAYSGSVSRGALAPVSSAPMAAQAPVLAPASPQPVRTAAAPALAPVAGSRLDATTTGTVQPPAMATAEAEPQGWSRAGGTQVTIKDGETVYNLSRRFGVPADVIMKSNGLSEQSGLKSGQKIVIPTYVYSHKAPVSAPDNNPKTASAKSSRGENLPDQLPKPADNVAVLPQAPKVREVASAPQASTDAGNQAKAATAPGTYKVQEGDTLTRIAKKTGVSVTALKQANGMEDGLVRIGQSLKVPAAGAAPATVATAAPAKADPVVTGAAAPAKPAKAEQVAAYTPPTKTEKVIERAVDNDVAAPEATGIGRMRWPVRGRVISNYGSGGGKANDGIDIAVPEGTPVKAAENGVVIYAGDGLKEFGNTVLVRHENGLVTVYGHASSLKVARGEKVKRGQEIAVSGMSGSTDAPKLHFEVRKNSAPVDPSTYLE